MKSSTEDLERWPDNEGNKIFQNFDDAVGLEIKWNEIWEARFGGGIRWANCWMDVFQIADEVISE